MALLSDDSVPRLLDDRYWLEAIIGHGGMGVVYRAVDRTMARPVAVKVVRSADGAALDEDTVGRFLREAKNTARLHHENIVEVFDMGRTGEGDLYLVMELLEGESLSVRLRRGERLSHVASVAIARQICAALHVAHAAGIVHRDLKPANVMLLRRGDSEPFVKVLDFGVAKSYAADQTTKLTRSGMLVGTIEYMAPEQILGQRVDARTDIYALGVVLYKMLTGRAPYREGGVPALIHAHLNVTPKAPSSVDPTIVPGLDAVTMRCLEKRPQDRFATMGEVAERLDHAFLGQGIPNLAYEEEDPYVRGDSTRVRSQDELRAIVANLKTEDTVRQGRLRVAAPGPLPETSKVDPPAPRATRSSDGPRASSPARGGDPRASVPPLPRGIDDDTTTRVRREHLRQAGEAVEAGTKPPRPSDRPRRSDPPRPCAMCGTSNSPFAIACAGCGMSLAAMDQEAARARKAGMGHRASRSPDVSQGAWSPPGTAEAERSAGGGRDPTRAGGAPSAWSRFLAWARRARR